MSKAGKKIMEKREREACESRISSSLPPSIPRPDYPKAVRVTPKEESGSNTGATQSEKADTPSSEITIKGVPIVYEPLLGDDEVLMVPHSTPSVEPKAYNEMRKMKGERRTAEIYDEFSPANYGDPKTDELVVNNQSWFTEEQIKHAKASQQIRTELGGNVEALAGKPSVEAVDLDKWVDDGGAIPPGPLTVEDAHELGKMTHDTLVEKSRQVGCSRFPSFEGSDTEYTEEEIKAKLRKAAEETVFISPGPEKTDGEEETPELAEVHEGTTQGSGTEAGQRDEEGSPHGSRDCEHDTEQVD